jgi:hypothetical protein
VRDFEIFKIQQIILIQKAGFIQSQHHGFDGGA